MTMNELMIPTEDTIKSEVLRFLQSLPPDYLRHNYHDPKVAAGTLSRNGFIAIDFILPDSEKTVGREIELRCYVDINSVRWESDSESTVTDKDGNEWLITRTKTEVNWAAYGGLPSDKALLALQFFTTVATWMEMLHRSIGDRCRYLLISAEERAARRIQMVLEDACTAARPYTKGMRVGKTVTFDFAEAKFLVGDHVRQFDIGKKSFEVAHLGSMNPGQFELMRIG